MSKNLRLFAIIAFGGVIVSSCSTNSFNQSKPAQPAVTEQVNNTAPKVMARGPVQSRPIEEASMGAPVQDRACASNQFSGLVGKKYQDIPKSQLPPYFRTLKPGQSLSMNQNMRVNLYLDDFGKVTKVTCG